MTWTDSHSIFSSFHHHSITHRYQYVYNPKVTFPLTCSRHLEFRSPHRYNRTYEATMSLGPSADGRMRCGWMIRMVFNDIVDNRLQRLRRNRRSSPMTSSSTTMPTPSSVRSDFSKCTSRASRRSFNLPAASHRTTSILEYSSSPHSLPSAHRSPHPRHLDYTQSRRSDLQTNVDRRPLTYPTPIHTPSPTSSPPSTID